MNKSVAQLMAWQEEPPPSDGTQQGRDSLIALAQQQDELESTVSNLQLVLKVQVESMQNQILQLERTLRSHFGTSDEKSNGFAGLQSDEKAVLAAKRSEERLEKLEKVNEQLHAVPHTDVSTALKYLEMRLDNLEKVQEVGLAMAQSHPADVNQPGPSTSVRGLEDLVAEVAEIQRWRAKVDANLIDNKQSDMGGDPAKETFDAEAVQAAIDKTDAYEFQASVYDAAFFVGVDCFGPLCSVMIGLSFMLTMLVQLSVVWFIKEKMTADPFPQEIRDQLASWRTFTGHSAYHASETGVSLASRVCAPDNTLIIATYQMNSFAGASGYLDGNGQFLCIIAIILWTFCCGQSLRTSLNFFMAILLMPRGKGNRSEIELDQEGVHMSTSSIHRVIIGSLVSVCRLWVEIFLLFYGSVFLAHQVNMPNLLLNASALSFVLDIDQIIFGVTAPSVVFGLVGSMRPVSLQPVKRILRVVPYFFLACIAGYTAAINFIYVDYLTDQLQSVISLLCSDASNLNVVMGTDALGRMIFANSVPFKHRSEDQEALLDAEKWAAELIINGNAEAHVYAEDLSPNTRDSGQDFANVDAVVERLLMNVAEIAALGRCMDMSSDASSSVDSKLGARLFVATGNVSFKSMSRCAEVKHLCTNNNELLLAQNVRLMCPWTCGCADPLSGLWDLATASSGCPRLDCQSHLISAASQGDYACEDKSLTELKVSRSWSLMVDRMFESKVINISVRASISSKGCTALNELDSTTRVYLCQNDGAEGDQFKFLGAGFFCPISCECFKDPNSTSPSSSSYTSSPYIPGGSGLCPRKACKEKYEQALLSR